MVLISVDQRLEKIEKFLCKFSTTFSQIFENSAHELLEIRDTQMSMTTQLNEVMIVMGVKDKYNIPDKYNEPSVWGSIYRNTKIGQRKFNEIKRDRQNQRSNWSQFVEQVQVLLGKSKQDFVKHQVFQSFLDRLNILLNVHGEKIKKAEKGLTLSATKGRVLATNTFNFGALESFGTLSTNLEEVAAFPMPETGTPPDVTMRLSAIEKSMQLLQTEMIRISGDKDTTIVKFGSLGFWSVADASAFVAKKPEA